MSELTKVPLDIPLPGGWIAEAAVFHEMDYPLTTVTFQTNTSAVSPQRQARFDAREVSFLDDAPQMGDDARRAIAEKTIAVRHRDIERRHF